MGVEVLMEDETVDMEIRQDPHQSMWRVEGVDSGPKRLVC